MPALLVALAFHFGPGVGVALPHKGGLALAGTASVEEGHWSAGLEYRYANFATVVLNEVAQSIGARADFIAWEGSLAPYVGVSGGFLWETAHQDLLKGAFAGGEVGLFIYRGRWGSLAVEGQLTVPLFGDDVVPALERNDQSFTVATALVRYQF